MILDFEEELYRMDEARAILEFIKDSAEYGSNMIDPEDLSGALSAVIHILKDTKKNMYNCFDAHRTGCTGGKD